MIAITCVYLLAASVDAAFNAVINVSGLLFAMFYVLTALATVAYYRRRILAGFADAVTLGILPLGAAAFLTWVLVNVCRHCRIQIQYCIERKPQQVVQFGRQIG